MMWTWTYHSASTSIPVTSVTGMPSRSTRVVTRCVVGAQRSSLLCPVLISRTTSTGTQCSSRHPSREAETSLPNRVGSQSCVRLRFPRSGVGRAHTQTSWWVDTGATQRIRYAYGPCWALRGMGAQGPYAASVRSCVRWRGHQPTGPQCLHNVGLGQAPDKTTPRAHMCRFGRLCRGSCVNGELVACHGTDENDTVG